MEQMKILAVVGPTAGGKSAFAVELAKRYRGEIISCDSMQIYRHLSIATAKPTAEEMQGIPHHLIDFLEPEASFSVAEYVTLATKAAEEITARGNLPILCGGTGLYYSALIDGLSFSEAGSDEALRRRLEAIASREGNAALLEQLRAVDPETAQRLHPNNLKRIIRALEHFELTGIPISEQNRRSREVPSRFAPLVFGIGYLDRNTLYERINRRVDAMVENGLPAEAEWYFAQSGFTTACAAIGYKELKPYFDGKITWEEALENLKKETRHYAKRQLTWFKRDERVHWLYADAAENTTLLEQATLVINEEKFLV